MEFVESKGEGNQYKYLHLVIIQGILYIFLQMSLFLLPIDPNIDYYNHINWGIGFENGLYPYSDFNSNEYPVLSVFGWIAAYNLSPEKTYIWLSVIMNFPYWILAFFGGITFYYLLIDYGIEDKKALYLVTFFFFLPHNHIDTLNNHGSLGTMSTIVISVFLWHRNKYFWSAGFIAAGFSIKLYPIFIVPFLIISIYHLRGRIKYSLYLLFWILFFHIPVLLIPYEYYEVLSSRTQSRGGLSYSVLLDVIFSPIGFKSFPTLIWLLALVVTTLILILEPDLLPLEKFTIILMVNNLLEPRGGVGHITTVLPFFAMYFLDLYTFINHLELRQTAISI
ncbi:MAG: glycosyltransferase 87 family protein [Candidatus Kariarchaeaceae archaeon]|jgi:hypothetical protein